MRSIAIIPARYASTRFPGKPLADLCGEPLIVRVARRVIGTGRICYVATDDERIKAVCEENSIPCVMTRTDHSSGTDRIYEAYRKITVETGPFDVVINVQGDEPFIDLEQLDQLELLFTDPKTDIGTLCTPYPADGGIEGLEDPNLVKVVTGTDNRAIYFSRSVIPYLRDVRKEEWPLKHRYLTHIGVYAYRPEALEAVTQLPRSELEKSESLEQLRWLENGMKIRVAMTPNRNIGIDTPADLEAARKKLSD